MKAITITNAELGKIGRMDASYVMMYQEHKILVEELLPKFTLEELTELALELPFDQRAANCIVPWNISVNNVTESRFRDWLAPKDSSKQKLSFRRARHQDLALYVARSSQYALAKGLTVMLELAKQRLKMIQSMSALIEKAKAKDAPHLLAAIKRSSGKDDDGGATEREGGEGEGSDDTGACAEGTVAAERGGVVLPGEQDTAGQ